jgi:hypothetical protein
MEIPKGGVMLDQSKFGQAVFQSLCMPERQRLADGNTSTLDLVAFQHGVLAENPELGILLGHVAHSYATSD